MKRRRLIGSVLVLLLVMAVPAMAGASVKPPPGDHYSFNCVTKGGSPFSDTFDGDLSQWTDVTGTGIIVVDDSNNVYQHMGGSYVGAVTAVAGSASWTNYTFEVDVKKVSGAYFNLVFRYVDELNYYMLEGGSSGGTAIALFKKVGGAFTELGRVPQVTANDTWYHYIIEVEGNSIKVWADGFLKFTVTDSAHSAGKIGLGGYGSIVQFDNVLVTGPNVGLGPNEILVPMNGPGMLGFVAGSPFQILDNDMTNDGQAWVQVPNTWSYDTFDQARGKPGGDLFWGNYHARTTGKPVWQQHNDPLKPPQYTPSGNWPFTNNGVTCYSFRLYALP